MTKIRLFLFLLLTPFFIIPALAQQSGLEITINDQYQPIIHHTLEQGQTLYGISKSYDADLNDLIAQLPGNTVDDLKIGQDIIVPINKDKICYRAMDCENTRRIPIYYTAQSKDNLFRIARIYFDSSVEQLKMMNHMTSTILSDNQVLTIGWLPYTDEWHSYLSTKQIEAIVQVTPQEAEIKEEIPTAAPEPVPSPESEPVLLTMNENKVEEVNAVLEGIGSRNERNNDRIYEDDITASPTFNPEHRKLTSLGATAYWNKNKSSKKGYYLLHKYLPINTMIRITNPVTNQTVLAKVVGKIPDNIYAPEISLVVTTEVARALGAIDKKFYTKITYPEGDL